ncbi:MAG TPA: hypothetical protein VG939_11170, partial [Caulobacteraceae bacterium]|nr:hypothetical protein [Caulobacteraceae bacterium]
SAARSNLGVTATGADTAYAWRANNLSDLGSVAAARGNLGLGTAATRDTGTSGSSVPLLDGANTWSSAQTFSGSAAFGGLATLNAGAKIAAPAAAMDPLEAGYMGLPQNAQSGSYALVAGDRGKAVFFTTNATASVPANAAVAFPVGTVISISADAGATVTITCADTLRLVPTNVTGSRTLVGPGTAWLEKKKATEWWARGDCT